MKLIALALSAWLTFAASAAHALDPACETYVRAAEKSAQQPARHTITETGGMRLEVIVIDGKTYSGMDGKWRRLSNGSSNQFAAEQKLIASIRSGEYPMNGCRKLGAQSVDGIETTVYAYTLKLPGLPSGEAKAFIGSDGLVHAQSTSDAKVRHRYRGVSAPAP
jgi:hypothetical protein